MVVCVNVGCGVGLSVGRGVLVGGKSGVRASATSVPSALAASAVCAMTVGRYSGGYAVGMGLAVGGAQAGKSKSRMARRIRFIAASRHVYKVNRYTWVYLCTCLHCVSLQQQLSTDYKSRHTSSSDSGRMVWPKFWNRSPFPPISEAHISARVGEYSFAANQAAP